jgi:hypothetical protein
MKALDPVEVLYGGAGMTRHAARFALGQLQSHGFHLIAAPEWVEEGELLEVRGNGFSINHDMKLTPEREVEEIKDAMYLQYARVLLNRVIDPDLVDGETEEPHEEG